MRNLSSGARKLQKMAVLLKTELRRMVISSLVITVVLMVVWVMHMMLRMSVRQGKQAVVEGSQLLEIVQTLKKVTVSRGLNKIQQQNMSQ